MMETSILLHWFQELRESINHDEDQVDIQEFDQHSHATSWIEKGLVLGCARLSVGAEAVRDTQ
jgi:hypothetical protein